MGAVLALITEILSMAPQIASAGISIAGIISKAQAVLAANAAPDDPTWAALDQQVKDLQAQLATGDVASGTVTS